MNEFAPEYTKKERLIIGLKIALWILPLILVSKFLFSDWLKQYTETAHCHFYFGINGAYLILYGMFVGIPLSLTLILLLLEGRRSLKILRIGQYPLPGEKVLRPTKYRYGNAARVRPAMVLLVLAFTIAIAVWGGVLTHKLTDKPLPTCEDAALDHG